ncbi:cytochrome c [Rufibacter sp. DG15C]|uniref:c-type cytochrome n=1 Tax=Rufibacter sp. DG15C TaxID=1379909 RepID=UPI00082B1FEF|nr:cytochrome c [Rufibacter sp. DG15C]
MPITAVLHTHVLVVILFLLLFLSKVVLLFLNKHDTLNKARSSTKVLDMIFGTLVLVTGAYLTFHFNGPLPRWLLVKIVLVLVAIPISIVGIKRHNKVLTAVGVLIFLYVYGVAETKSMKMSPEQTVKATVPNQEQEAQPQKPQTAANPILSQLEGTHLQNTKAIYTQLCATCHGEDGQKGMSGASNLQQSTLSVEDRKAVIANGRGLMPGFGSQLSEQEQEALAQYTTMLKNE